MKKEELTEEREQQIFQDGFSVGMIEGKLKAQEEMKKKLKEVMYGKIDWCKVFKDAYENRKKSWFELGHIKEWRNATDEVLLVVWHQLKKELFQNQEDLK